MKKSIEYLLLGSLAIGGASLTGCTSMSIPEGERSFIEYKLQNSSLIVGFEGTQPFSGYRIEKLARGIASELNLAHSATSGNPKAHMSLIRRARQNGQSIYIIGYSAGAADARALAEKCHHEGIPIRGVFLLDPTYLSFTGGKIPSNVERVVCYRSNSPDWVTGRVPDSQIPDSASGTSVSSESIYSGHMGLPQLTEARIRDEIRRLESSRAQGEQYARISQASPSSATYASPTPSGNSEIPSPLSREETSSVYAPPAPVSPYAPLKTEPVRQPKIVEDYLSAGRVEKERQQRNEKISELENKREKLRNAINKRMQNLSFIGSDVTRNQRELAKMYQELSEMDAELRRLGR